MSMLDAKSSIANLNALPIEFEQYAARDQDMTEARLEFAYGRMTRGRPQKDAYGVGAAAVAVLESQVYDWVPDAEDNLREMIHCQARQFVARSLDGAKICGKMREAQELVAFGLNAKPYDIADLLQSSYESPDDLSQFAEFVSELGRSDRTYLKKTLGAVDGIVKPYRSSPDKETGHYFHLLEDNHAEVRK